VWVFRIRLGVRGLARTRFAISPLSEVFSLLGQLFGRGVQGRQASRERCPRGDPRPLPVGAEGAGMQPLAEVLRGVRRPLVHAGDQPVQMAEVALCGVVQHLRDAGVVRVDDAVDSQRVEDLRTIRTHAYGLGQVGDRITRAAPRGTNRAQHSPARVHRRLGERLGCVVGQDGDQDDLRDPVRVRDRVPLGDVRAVRDSVHRGRVGAESRAQLVQIGDRVRGAVETAVRPDRRGAVRHRLRGGHGQVGSAHLLLKLGALQRGGASSPLVDQHHPVVRQGGRDLAAEPGGERDTSLAGPTGEQQQDVGRGRLVLDGHRQVERAPVGAVVVERHAQR